jgi:hypothetical protein
VAVLDCERNNQKQKEVNKMAFQEKLDIKAKGRKPDLKGYFGSEQISIWLSDELREKLGL